MALDVTAVQEGVEEAVAALVVPATVIRKSRTPANATQPWRGPGESLDEEVEIFVTFVGIESESKIPFRTLMQKNDQIKRQADKCMVTGMELAAAGIEDINQFDTLIYKNETWTITACNVIRPTGVVIVAELYLTR
jgi:hypothetical protein